MEKIIAAGSRATHLLVGGGIAWVLEVGSVDAGGVAAAGADCNRERSGQASGNNVLTLELQTIYRRCFHNHQSLLGPTVSKREIDKLS